MMLRNDDIPADVILNLTRPEDLFPLGEVESIRAEYRRLSKRWHPDTTDGSAMIFAHIGALYREALLRVRAGKWQGRATVELTDKAGKTWTFVTRTSYDFEHGTALVCDDRVVYIFNAGSAHRVAPTVREFLSGWRFASPKMHDEFVRYLPTRFTAAELTDGRAALVVEKDNDTIRLADLQAHLGAIDPKHVAWITSGFLNIACYLEWAGLVHHDISLENLYVSPARHHIQLVGGWWECAHVEATVKTVPRRTFNVMPHAARLSKKALTTTNIELIKLTARECLKNAGAPEPMRRWLTTVDSRRSIEIYRDWVEKTLTQSFGKRMFTVMPVNADSVYSQVKTHG